MARKDQAEALLRQGFDPSAIARKMGISFSSVVQYLCTRVGERGIRFSDIYFSISKEKRSALQSVIETLDHGKQVSLSRFATQMTWEEVFLFRSLRDRKIFAGDMYEYISELEITLHNLVRKILISAYGADEGEWWRRGIAADIREKCASRQELDDEVGVSKYCYTDLIDLSKIILKNWPHFQHHVPQPYRKDRKRFERDLRRLNALRNTVMHPIKLKKWSEDDFLFVRDFQSAFSPLDKVKA
ncbi:MAG TPA: hypothetical protein VEW46_25840 [Pyrinomonadaceae bacterium]|nr:hypothetical protein [Pyrinomonadaceae bacterium]